MKTNGYDMAAAAGGTSVSTLPAAPARFMGIDVGAETVKLVELFRDGDSLRLERFEILEHGKNPGPVLRESLRHWNWSGVDGAAVSGRFSS